MRHAAKRMKILRIVFCPGLVLDHALSVVSVVRNELTSCQSRSRIENRVSRSLPIGNGISEMM